MTYKRKEIIGDAVLYLADSYEMLVENNGWQELGYIDVVITDPPWGVNLGDTGSSQEKLKKQRPYEITPDTPQYIAEKIVPVIKSCIDKVGRLIITPGSRCNHLYPQPQDVAAWFNPNGNGYSPWGFHTTSLIYYYGKDPNRGKKITPNGTMGKHSRAGEFIDHPCPKPLMITKWLVSKGSIEGETILDVFGGSATVAVAALDMGRKTIYIDICEKYFNDACSRVERAQLQGRIDYEEKPVTTERIDFAE